MDACLSVDRELEKVASKFNEIDEVSRSSIDEVIQYIQNIRKTIIEETEGSIPAAVQSLLLTQCIIKIRDTINEVSSEHKDLHLSVSKVGKAIDRNFVSDFNDVVKDSIFDDSEKRTQLNHVIVEHFLQQGNLDIAKDLISDASLQIEDWQTAPFLELHAIKEALRNHDIQPALLWAASNREKLKEKKSCLEFKLHRLNFIALVRRGAATQTEALLYASNLAPFAASHTKEVQILMGSLMYQKQGLENSPYAYLLDPINWLEICDIFTSDVCSLLGLSVENPLDVAFSAGCQALPLLLNVRQVMQQKQCPTLWSSKEELPVEINVGRERQYHSVFACPILRQQSTDTNPPVRLVCGHVISKDALNKLATANRVKCPYCPMEQLSTAARQIYF